MSPERLAVAWLVRTEIVEAILEGKR